MNTIRHCPKCHKELMEIESAYTSAESTWKCSKDGIYYKSNSFGEAATISSRLTEVGRMIETHGAGGN